MRNTKEIKVWMIREELRAVDIRDALGYKDSKPVRATLHGTENNRRVLRWLLDNGCPEKFLDLPDDMRAVA